MSQDELYAVTARVVDEFTSAAMLFTALDISNAVKQTFPDARHREISPIVRDLFERRGMGAYTQTGVDCNPPKPRTFPCPPGVTEDRPLHVAELPDATCVVVPDGCRDTGCAKVKVDCPPEGAR